MRRTINGTVRQQPWVSTWGPKAMDAWPPEVTYGTYPAYLLMRIWLRENAWIFETGRIARVEVSS